MGQQHVTARIPDDLYEAIEEMREAEQLDRSAAIKRLLQRGMDDWRLEMAISRYQDDTLSLGRAAEEAGLSIWRLLDELDERGIEASYTQADLAADLAAVREGE